MRLLPIMFKARIVSEKFSCSFHNDVLIVILDHNTLWSRHYVQVIFFICLTIFLLMKKVVLCIDGNNKHTSCADGAMVACIIDSVLAGFLGDICSVQVLLPDHILINRLMHNQKRFRAISYDHRWSF